ncbi:MAG: hypothetical protein JWP31_2191 [Aeromicrobium sp.]|nr:hypothetical protein [Aeromicrobium sp.]
MHPARRPALLIVPVVVLLVAVGAGWWASARDADARASLASALDVLPADTQVAGFTDWASVRAATDEDARTPSSVRAALTDDAALRDLTTRSVLGQSIERMERAYGWSAADLDWESYGQAAAGSALVLRLDRAMSFDDIEQRLTKLGYARDGDVWRIGAAGRAEVGPELSAVLGSLHLLPRERLVVAGSRPAYADAVVATIRGRDPSLLSHRAAADVAAALAGSDTALVQTGRRACRATSFRDEGPDEVGQAEAALARAGRLVSPTFAGRGLVDGRPRQSIRFALGFDSPATAASQVPVRSTLTRGAFIGRTGAVEDSLDLRDADVQGSTLTFRFDVDPDRGAYMSGEGPLLFAGCPL